MPPLARTSAGVKCGRPRRWRAETVLLVVALAIWGFTFDDFGATWDQTPHIEMGEAARRYLFAAESFESYAQFPVADSIYYSPALDVVGAVAIAATGADPYKVRHALQGLLWVAMVWPVCGLGRRLAGNWGAWAAGLALLGLPTLFGHSCNNPKDLPLASAVAWMAFAATWVAGARRIGWRHALGLGVAYGGVVATRPGAWFFIALAGLPLLMRAWTAVRSKRAVGASLLRALWIVPVTIAIGWVMMIALWPHAHQSPLLHPIRSANFARHFADAYPVLFGGTTLPSNALPWDYLPRYVLLTTPIPLLLLALWGHVALVRRMRRSAAVWPAALALAFVLWFPLVYCVVARPNVYDGMRHFLFILPALAPFAGAGAVSLGSMLSAWLGRWRVLAPAALLVSAWPQIVALHPYQASYFNALAGPPEKLHERYELDFWISSYREAAQWINARQSAISKPLNVLVAANDFSLPAFRHYLAPKIQVRSVLGNYSRTTLPEDFDYYVSMVRYGQWRNFPGRPIVHRIAREGMLFAIIRGPARHAEP